MYEAKVGANQKTFHGRVWIFSGTYKLVLKAKSLLNIVFDQALQLLSLTNDSCYIKKLSKDTALRWISTCLTEIQHRHLQWACYRQIFADIIVHILIHEHIIPKCTFFGML